jgi:nucleoside-diphosphate-sugar epimerase
LLVYTSGVWVHGSTGDEAVDETTPLHPPAFIAPRVEQERLVLGGARGGLRTLVIRPGCVYGGSGGLTGAWFASAVNEGTAQIVGDGDNRWAMIHVEDLAELYVGAVESPYGGEIFNATDRSRFTVVECARAASRAAGAGGKVQGMPVAEAARTWGPMAECLALDQHVDSRKAVRLLNWQPRHGGFVDGAARYFLAWKASAR